MVTKSWMYDAMIYIYALSLLFYFADFAERNQNAKRMGTGLLILVWVLQTFFFIARMYQYRYMPIVSRFEILFFFTWLLVTVSLVMSRFFRLDVLVFFVNVMGFAVLALNLFSDPSVMPLLRQYGTLDELLFIHNSLAVGSNTAFSVAAILSGMYLFLHGKLKGRQWSENMRRLPSLEKIEKYTYFSVIVGTPLLILSFTLGVVWLSLQGSNQMELLIDPRIVISLLVLTTYTFYLIQRLSFKNDGYKLAIYNLVAYILVFLNFIIVGLEPL